MHMYMNISTMAHIESTSPNNDALPEYRENDEQIDWQII